MTWTSTLPLGLFKRVRTFTLSPQAGLTHLAVKEAGTGPLAGYLRITRSATARALDDFVRAVTNRAELLERAL